MVLGIPVVEELIFVLVDDGGRIVGPGRMILLPDVCYLGRGFSLDE